MAALQRVLGFTPQQSARTVLRSDAGFGSDANIYLALAAHWHVLTKGKAGRRPPMYASRIAEASWSPVGPQRWIAPAVAPYQYVQPTQHLVLRWLTPSGEVNYVTLICSILDWSLAEVVAHYDQRGACETEIQADKQGLKLERRRKKQRAAQEALLLLADVAHNLLAWSRQWMFPHGTLAEWGTLRTVEDILCLSGRLWFENQRLVEVHLNARHPHVSDVAEGLHRLLDHFGWP